MRDRVSVWLLSALLTMVPLMGLGFGGCATTEGQSLRIDARQVPAVQYMPDEITSVLEDLGYQLIPDPYPATTAQRHDQIRMQFRARDASGTRIDVHIQLVSKVTGLNLYRVVEGGSRVAAPERFAELKRQVELRFGAENVTETRTLLLP